MANVTIEVNFGKTTLDAIRSLTMKAAQTETEATDDMTSIENDDGAPRARRTRSKKEETYDTADVDTGETEEYEEEIDTGDEPEETEEEEEAPPAKAAKPRVPQIQDVQAALISYRKRNGNNDAGHKKALAVMKKVTGHTTLAKVDSKKYGKLIAALK